MSSKRKVYTEEFKREAVRLAKERGNLAQTARKLGLSDNTLQGWTSQDFIDRQLRHLSCELLLKIELPELS